MKWVHLCVRGCTSVCTHVHVGMHLWGLGGHLDGGLQDGDGEVWVRGGAEPQSEVRVARLHL